MTLRHGQCRFGASAGLGGAFGIAGFAGALSRGFNLATGPGVGGGAAGAEEPTFTARPNSRHLPATGARRSKLTCTGADREKSGHPHDVVLDPRRHRQLRIEHKRARKIEIVIALPGENLAEPRGRVHRLETGRAEIAQNCIIVCLVGLIEREQGRTDCAGWGVEGLCSAGLRSCDGGACLGSIERGDACFPQQKGRLRRAASISILHTLIIQIRGCDDRS